MTKRHASSKKARAYKRQWPKCALVSRFSRGGKLFLDSDRLDIRAQISAVPSLSLSLCPVQKEGTRMKRRRCLFRFIPWREIERKKDRGKERGEREESTSLCDRETNDIEED